MAGPSVSAVPSSVTVPHAGSEINRSMIGIETDSPAVGAATVETPLDVRAAAEFDRYVATMFPGLTSVDCPLRWWRETGQSMFPLLAPVARMCLSVLATSAPVERVFSRAKFWTRDERGGTGDDVVSECTSLGVLFSQPGFDLTSLFADIVPVIAGCGDAAPIAPLGSLFV